MIDDTGINKHRLSWDAYFINIAELVASRSTCLAIPVGAVIVKSKQIIATGYNGVPSGVTHCIDQGYCYLGLKICTDSKQLPSRAIHAEANAIAQAAKRGISVEGAIIYITFEPCLNCLKLILAAGLSEIVFKEYRTNYTDPGNNHFLEFEKLIKYRKLD